MRMELQDNNDGWRLALQDGLLQLIQIDFRLGLFLCDASAKAQLFVETSCRLKGKSIDVILNPSDSRSLAPILSLFNAKVRAVEARKTGKLVVQFGDGHSLEVDPHESFEAWQLRCSTGFMLVCSPGGKVSFFQQTERSAKSL
jgi:hypothetical protein